MNTTSTPAGRMSSRASNDPALRDSYYTYDGLGRLRCANGTSGAGCPDTSDSVPPETQTWVGYNYVGLRDLRGSTVVKAPDGTTESATYVRGYYDATWSLNITSTACPTATNPCTATLTYGYDNNGNRVSEVDSRYTTPGPQRLMNAGPT